METKRQKQDLRNRNNKHEAIQAISSETYERKVLSFYRYCKIDRPDELRDHLFEGLSRLQVLGRIYLATEGINAQISVPKPRMQEFRSYLESIPGFIDIPFKMALEDDAQAFIKLIIKVKERIVADGLSNLDFDSAKCGKHLNAREWNEFLEREDAVVVDMRNCYESEVGKFTKAITPQVETFREELPLVRDMLSDSKDKPVLLYCTGGIRCEKASAFLLQHGFKEVYQLHGGIIDYARQVKEENLPSQFKGKNFVFDERKGERITDDVIANCHQCGGPSDRHVNCANDDCHLLFIQCEQCAANTSNCCSQECCEHMALPEDVRKAQRDRFLNKRQSHYLSDLPYSPFRELARHSQSQQSRNDEQGEHGT